MKRLRIYLLLVFLGFSLVLKSQQSIISTVIGIDSAIIQTTDNQNYIMVLDNENRPHFYPTNKDKKRNDENENWYEQFTSPGLKSGDVSSITSIGDTLYIAGSFWTENGKYIAKWNGTKWISIVQTTDSYIRLLAKVKITQH